MEVNLLNMKVKFSNSEDAALNLTFEDVGQFIRYVDAAKYCFPLSCMETK